MTEQPSLDELTAEWAALGPALVVVTRGGDGALVRVTGSGEQETVPAAATRLVDTVGAGDSFMAGLLSGMLDADLLGSVEARGRLRNASLREVAPAVERAYASQDARAARVLLRTSAATRGLAVSSI